MSCSIVNNKYRRIITVFAVNEESEDDEGYGSIAGYDPAKHRKFRTKGKEGKVEILLQATLLKYCSL